MTIAQAVPLADGWGMHNGSGGWWILGAAVMMLFMGGMMWMMMRGMGGGSSSTPGEPPSAKESPSEILERRLAEGEISIEEYRERRQALVDGAAAESAGADEDRLTAAGAEAERRS